MKKPLQFCNFSVDISHIEHLYVAIHNYKVIHIQYFKTNWPRKIDGNYFILAFRLVINNLAKRPFFVVNSWLCCHCRNLAKGGCPLSQFHFMLCHYFLGHVACPNWPWQGCYEVKLAWFVILIIHAFCPSSGEGTYKSDEMKVEEGTLTTAHLCFRTLYGTMDVTELLAWGGRGKQFTPRHMLCHMGTLWL